MFFLFVAAIATASALKEALILANISAPFSICFRSSPGPTPSFFNRFMISVSKLKGEFFSMSEFALAKYSSSGMDIHFITGFTSFAAS